MIAQQKRIAREALKAANKRIRQRDLVTPSLSALSSLSKSADDDDAAAEESRYDPPNIFHRSGDHLHGYTEGLEAISRGPIPSRMSCSNGIDLARATRPWLKPPSCSATHDELNKELESLLVAMVTDMYQPPPSSAEARLRGLSTSFHVSDSTFGRDIRGMAPKHPMRVSSRLFSAKADSTETRNASTAATSSSSSASSDGKSSPQTPGHLEEVSFAKRAASIPKQVQDAAVSAVKAIFNFLIKLPGWSWFYLTHPKETREALESMWEMAKKEAHHYYIGSKLLFADVQTAYKLLQRTLQGSALTRRERKQLLRTTSDLFRLVPFSMFLLIPFMEFALPFALRIFPNMLPSTFQDSLKAEENMKRELKSRIAMAQFFQETLQEMAKDQKKQAASRRKSALGKDEEADTDGAVDEDCIEVKKEDTARSFLEFLEKARKGEMIPPDVIIQFSKYFQDEMTLDNMPRMQLVNMCRYMNIAPYGTDAFLQFQLRHRIRTLKEDDQRILWEGIDSLTKMELREACQERGMRSTGLSKDAYKASLQQWLELSVNKNVPVTLLIMSRAFFLREESLTRGPADEDGSKSLAGLADAISGLDKDVVNEVVLEVATAEEKKRDPSVTRIKLEVLEAQNERIEEEKAERDAATKKKEEKEKVKEEKEKEKEKEKEAKQIEGKEEVVAIEEQTEQAEKQTETETPTVVTIKETVASPSSKETDVESGTVAAEDEKEESDDEADELSSQEIDAISQLVNPDPVNSEREELERIKAAMKEEEVSDEEGATGDAEASGETIADADASAPLDTITSESSDVEVEKAISEMNKQADKVAEAATQIVEKAEEVAEEVDTSSGDQKLDDAIDRLKSRVSSMVDKIETQLTDVKGKIGDKLHFIDKDMDGILTQEELAEALQKVLKRDLTHEEAMHIAAEMDVNNDGVFTVAELAEWIEENKLVSLLKEGKDADIDRLIGKKPEEEEEQKEASA
uniref:Mitochondrial proton/calcium exchanger protein n=1 Tax=Grammatophora oceanica TaxID=210454 RepID=A0A7S1Y8D5_9STRA|mmetsp:Transcript_36856/g.54896  ORF Transcript_36856/g.54896 Transcript_36856/m.54896 type:complete len:974 (+) Transcript_36856:72-2993(+)|eukprot:CAMPEP_0194048222 /NCGR_PEP_ID=MMETSP0009_2-20130614/26795_1 /TAXON_ID=210454 /ORGANISM="Grammatophora oceanica, Strain CCMP 410" /LENGTH=973 /DNA_ID=CAMNT_0038694041 /DNA_START=53 /DNA_END=2974 /DNA_ORIENTATION=+